MPERYRAAVVIAFLSGLRAGELFALQRKHVDLAAGTATGRPLASGSRTVMFSQARAAIGRDDLTGHDLRHSAMTLVALTGATLPELMQRAGHSTPRAALHYQHAANDAQVRIAQRLDAMAPRRTP